MCACCVCYAIQVVIVELLSVCVETQPGLIEIFLNLQLAAKPADNKDSKNGKNKESKVREVDRKENFSYLIERKNGYTVPPLLSGPLRTLDLYPDDRGSG